MRDGDNHGGAHHSPDEGEDYHHRRLQGHMQALAPRVAVGLSIPADTPHVQQRARHLGADGLMEDADVRMAVSHHPPTTTNHTSPMHISAMTPCPPTPRAMDQSM